jgi:predicted DCC family thiol-disulfide oxidoreductase YuxK
VRPDTLLIDGDCALCRATGDWLAARVASDEIRVLELQRVGSDPVVAEVVAGLALDESLTLVLADGEVLRGAAAVVRAGRHVAVVGVLARVYDHPIGRALWQPVYHLVARNRHRIGRALCPNRQMRKGRLLVGSPRAPRRGSPDRESDDA